MLQITPIQFSNRVIQTAASSKISVTDALIQIVAENEMEYNEVPDMLTPNLREQIRREAEDKRLLPRRPSLATV